MNEKETIIKLRNQTGAGIMDIKEALEKADGDEQKACDFLRLKGQKIAAKRADREAREGWIGSYVHANGKIASLVKLACETDFVARNQDFKDLAHDLAMQVTASNPLYLSSSDIPSEVLDKEKGILMEEIEKQGKPKEMAEKILQGKLEKYYSDVCLLNQRFVKDDSKTVVNLIEEATTKIGEKIEIVEFKRMEI
jgi:elongation factor Ts